MIPGMDIYEVLEASDPDAETIGGEVSPTACPDCPDPGLCQAEGECCAGGSSEPDAIIP